MDFDKEIDARGLNCPLPILRCKKGLSDMADNTVLKIVATDAGSVKDFEAFCNQTGHELLSLDATENATEESPDMAVKIEFTFYIRKQSR